MLTTHGICYKTVFGGFIKFFNFFYVKKGKNLITQTNKLLSQIPCVVNIEMVFFTHPEKIRMQMT